MPTRDGTAEPAGPPALDRIVHERARLMILTRLASAEGARASFVELKEDLGFTAGNLSVQLKNLEEAGYVAIEKSFRDNKPYTEASLTDSGDRALRAYLEEMERLIGALRGSAKK